MVLNVEKLKTFRPSIIAKATLGAIKLYYKTVFI